MKGRRKETKLATKLDRSALKKKAKEEKVTKKEKRSRGAPEVRLIGDDFSSQNEEAEDELERTGRGPT
jgi:hypothetical protein